ncbi:peptide ABC transporter substrate-binding protein [Virgibacillus halodenitrificans]|uniref:peptide ABC transporter substrate-binding protein n=1 Tax=Virgibacillus halodenitrificans TaxID=1482 RepID=UPI00045CAB4B|nr:peptide ABC transporter substrate-binding protein [Virgibacillus halodenitrificans]MCG1029692.1 peptide ABC transporter substrate-binding protein [Virgibacillus halodenitrificans]CDQ32142.1 Dipeptide-binding protein DppE precursor [Virgibacillus halodenitrificans]
MKSFRKLSLLLVAALLLSIMAACGGDDNEDNAGDSAEGNNEQVLHLTNGDTIPTMDASMATDEYAFQFLSSTTDGLYRLGENGEIKEGIATNHEVSEDALTWTFNLREGAVWSNGDPVTANDFVYAWQRAVNPDTGSEYGPYMMSGVIKNASAISSGDKKVDDLGVKALDDYTLEVTLEKPTPYFESLTTFGTFLPLNQKFVEEQGKDYATSTDTLLSNGPFILKDWESTANKWKLVKNPDYWDADTVQLDEITYDVVKNPQTLVDLYEKGEIDRADLSSDLVDLYSTRDDFNTITESSMTFIKFNQTKSEALKNENIRKALSRAVDKQALVDEILNNGSLVSNGAVPQDFAAHPETGEDFRDINGDMVTFSKDEAKKYWEKGLEEIGQDKVELEFLSGDSETSKVMNEYIANQLQTNLPGLTVTLKQVPFEQRLDLTTNMDYDIAISAWGADYLDPYGWLNLWLTDGGNNETGYSSEEYDKLVQSTVGDLAQKPVERFEASLEAEKVLFDDAVIAPLFQKARAQLISPELTGVINNSFGAKYEYKWASME